MYNLYTLVQCILNDVHNDLGILTNYKEDVMSSLSSLSLADNFFLNHDNNMYCRLRNVSALEVFPDTIIEKLTTLYREDLSKILEFQIEMGVTPIAGII
ncbi:MAG: hypothetical protein KC414_13360 [Romboutsia sp.]|nr:hypothetical protein [Romboutsia sp.]